MDMQPISHSTQSSNGMDNAIRIRSENERLPPSQLPPEQMTGLVGDGRVCGDCPNPNLFAQWCLCNPLGLRIHQVVNWFQDSRRDTTNGEGSQVEAARAEGSSSSQKNESRCKYTAQQIARLEEVFKNSMYPNPNMKLRLSEELGMTVKQVMRWFQNRRRQMKKRNGDQDQSASAEELLNLDLTPEQHARLKELLEGDLYPNLDLSLSLNNESNMTPPPVKYWFQSKSYESMINESEADNPVLLKENKRQRKDSTYLKASESVSKCQFSGPNPGHPCTGETKNLQVNRMYIKLDNLDAIPVMWLFPSASVQLTSGKDN